LGGTGLNRVDDAEVMYADDPDDPNPSRMAKIRPLPTRILADKDGAPTIECDLNASGPGRGWEILRISIR
jgi:hypothetical protein